MGLDGVEIVMAVEDAFGVEIKDSDALKMVPRDVIDFVAEYAEQKRFVEDLGVE